MSVAPGPVFGPLAGSTAIQELAPGLRDRRAWIESNVQIQNKKRERVPLRFNAAQDQLWARWSSGGGMRGLREVVHKARQEGVSTLVEAMILDELRHVPNTRAVIVDRELNEAHRKLDTLKFMYDNLPDDQKPRLHYNNRDEMSFPDLGSSVYIGKAGARRFGRGQTIHIALLSEIAFYADPEAIYTGVLAAVPRGEGAVFLESTANGAGTWWHGFYRGARDGANDFRATFLPWHSFPEYRVSADGVEGGTSPAGTPPLEREAWELEPPYGALDDDQVRWYRGQRRLFGEKTPQEFPSGDEEAFLHSGRVRFDTAAILRRQAAAPEPIRRDGPVTVYEEPVDGRTYSIGADTAEGIAGGDYDAAIVVDDRTGVEVAALWGTWPMHVYADRLMALGRRYNDALLAVERNNHGHTVLQRILIGDRAAGVQPYPPHRVYRHLDYDEVAKKQVPKPGWPEDRVTKPILEDGIEKLLAEHPECFVDGPTLSELVSLIYIGTEGRVGAPAGAHDDRFIARGIAEQVRARSMAQTGGGFAGGVVTGPAGRRRLSPLGDVIDPGFTDPRGA